MTVRNTIKIAAALLLAISIAIGLISINHRIILKWVIGSAKRIGRPINATVYTDGRVNRDVKVFHDDSYWGSNDKANNYLINLPKYDSNGMLKFFNVNLDEKWIGRPVSTNEVDYDFIMGHLFQSETGGHFTPFEDDIKGFGFNPQLSFTERQIKFHMPPNTVGFDSVRIELQ